MKHIVVLLILFKILICYGAEELHILNDNCINTLLAEAAKAINNDKIFIIRDSRGIILRFFLDNPNSEYDELSAETLKKIVDIKEFLAKIKNSAIIEVHTENSIRFKNWELSSVIAGRVESEVLKNSDSIDISRIKSVGYGEFLPAKNTPYNGGNLYNRVDIIILCNITGE